MKYALRYVFSGALALILVAAAMPAASAVKKAPAKKAPVKKAPAKPAPTGRVVQGTKQLDGNQAQLGVTYTLGKERPINVTLDKVEYTVEPVRYGNEWLSVTKERKFMVLHYTLHNPRKEDYTIGWSTLNILAVDAQDTNWTYAQKVAMEDTQKECYMSLKPAQKTKVYTSIVVPAKGEIPKIMFQSSDNLVLRYDVRGKVKPLPAPIADPADTTGATALENVPSQMGTYYPIRYIHAKVDSVEYSTDSFKGREPGDGKRFLVVKATVKNNSPRDVTFGWSTLTPTLTDADGGEIGWNQEVYFASRDDTVYTSIEPGKELRVRYVFEVPKNIELVSLALRQDRDGRAFTYDLSGVK